MKKFIVLVGVIGCLVLLGCEKKSDKVGYVVSAKLLQGYTGTKDVKLVLEKKNEWRKFQVDSLSAVYSKLAQLKPVSKEVSIKLEYLKNQAYNLSEEEKTSIADAEGQLWNQINAHLISFGKQEGYTMIFGATGNGNLMFADSTLDVTDKVVKFMNDNYAKENKK